MNGETLRIEPVVGDVVRVGDRVVFHPRPRGGAIRSPSSDDLAIYRVIRVGKKDLTKRWRRELEMLRARVFLGCTPWFGQF